MDHSGSHACSARVSHIPRKCPNNTKNNTSPKNMDHIFLVSQCFFRGPDEGKGNFKMYHLS